MKIYSSFFATFLVVLLSSLLTQNVGGQTTNPIPSPLPLSLPIGDRQRMLDWVVTNVTGFTAVTIYFTNKSDPLYESGLGYGVNTRWNTYAEYKDFTVSNAFLMFSQNKTGMVETSSVMFRPYVFYHNVGPRYVFQTLNTDSNVGIVSMITSNSFASAQPDELYVVVSVPKLQLFSITNDSGYSYCWTPTSVRQKPSFPASPFEFTTNDAVILNEWYSLATNRVRFTIVASGVTNVYSQFGEVIASHLTMRTKSEIEVSVVRGSDTCIESSTNMINWTLITNILSSPTNTLIVPIDTTKKCLFFRAIPS